MQIKYNNEHCEVFGRKCIFGVCQFDDNAQLFMGTVGNCRLGDRFNINYCDKLSGI